MTTFPIVPGQVQPFNRLIVDYIYAGNARVVWEMQRHFIDPLPHTFQLQVGHTPDNAATDWVDVGSPVQDAFFTVDPTKRLFGKFKDLHYRVKITTPAGTYYSEPTPI